MTQGKATACACSNLAFIKYWGNTDDSLRLPANGSLSMNLGGLITRTTVNFRDDLTADIANLDGRTLSNGKALERISKHLDHFRKLTDARQYAVIDSASNFPVGAGIASSASAFAALTLAAASALDLDLTERQLTTYARLGSGSASRSVPGGFVEWYPGATHEESYAETFALADHWAITDLVAIVSREHKQTGSTEGHATAATSPLQDARVADAPRRLNLCKQAVLNRDFEQFAHVVEQDSNIMHSVMMTGSPSLFYWQATTMTVMSAIRELRADGVAVCYTIDAGPNVHCLCAPGAEEQARVALEAIPGVDEILTAPVGGKAYIE